MKEQPVKEILIAGGGPAGAAAAIAARLEGSPVRLMDRAASCRHKVCGEFISPEVSELLEALHVWHDFGVLRPCPIRRCKLHLERRTEQWNLPESAWGLSRLQLDRMLIEKASFLGAVVSRGEGAVGVRTGQSERHVIFACGRTPPTDQRDRLFGFKTHFEGPADDAVELFFDACGYIGVSSIEDGLTNVCGIAPESVLQRYGFDFDEIVVRSPGLAERLRPLQRKMRWFVTGPLSFAPPSKCGFGSDVYPAGDSLTFVDPFTGSGILNALLTGRLAGLAAARRVPASEYVKACRSLLGRAFFISSVLRRMVGQSEIHWLLHYLPGQAVFRLTRASFAGASGNHPPAWSRQ